MREGREGMIIPGRGRVWWVLWTWKAQCALVGENKNEIWTRSDRKGYG